MIYHIIGEKKLVISCQKLVSILIAVVLTYLIIYVQMHNEGSYIYLVMSTYLD